MKDFKELKESDTVCTISELPSAEWSSLRTLTMERIWSLLLENQKKFQKVRLDSFIDRRMHEQEISECSSIADMGKPFRISNLQLFVPEIRQICGEFFSTHNALLNCHLFFFSSQENPQPYYHSDSQHTLAYQLSGSSHWKFPKEKGEFVKDASLKQFKNVMLDEGILKCEEVGYELNEHQLLFVPYGFSRNILCNSQSPSIYLSFGEEEVVLNDVVEYLGEQLLGIGRLNDRFFDEVNVEQLKQSHPLLTADQLESKISDMFFRAKLEKFKGGGRL